MTKIPSLFDARNEGYEEGERPQEQTVTVTNDGNSAVVLKQPISTSGNYEVGALDKTSLVPTEKAVFTVQPNLWDQAFLEGCVPDIRMFLHG